MTNLTDALHIPDTQSARDERHLAIQRVGVKDVRYPLQLRVAGAVQSTAALWSLDVALPAEKKGTHMSRFVAWLDALRRAAGRGHAARAPCRDAATSWAPTKGRIEAAFSFFLRKRAPVSGVQSLLDYQGRWIAETRAGATTRVGRGGRAGEEPVPVLQGDLRLRRAQPALAGDDARRAAAAPIEWHELVRFAEDSASSEIWPMLKRSDEKWVTERAYENPKFVEDLVRDVALRLNADARIGRYTRGRRELRVDPQPLRLRPHRARVGPAGALRSVRTDPDPGTAVTLRRARLHRRPRVGICLTGARGRSGTQATELA